MSIISEYEIVNGMFVRRDEQDVEELIEQNRVERLSGLNEQRNSNMRKVASIPFVLVEALKTRPMKDGGPIDLNLLGIDVEHTVRFNKWLNDRDNQAFRTSEARQ